MSSPHSSRETDGGEVIFPTGWFWVGWSHELHRGDPPRPLRHFGRDLVLYRGASGRPVVLDAHCPHLGAHLGYGGTVCDDDIVCPFHGWRWAPDGSHVEIPYDDRTPTSRTVGSWAVHEVGGVILVWHDARGRPPAWTPREIPEVGDPGFYPLGDAVAATWRGRRVAPENPIENVCDPAHLKYVHGAGSVPSVISFGGDGHRFGSVLEYHFGEGHDSTWLTPDGPVLGRLDAQSDGIGISVTRYHGIHETIQIFGVTPVEGDLSDVWSAIVPRRLPGDDGPAPTGIAAKIVRHFNGQFEADFPIWEHMAYVPNPPLARVEAKAFTSARRWIRQFYDGTAGEGRPSEGPQASKSRSAP